MDDLSAQRRLLEPSLVATRRSIHQNPELAFCETATAALVAERLQALGMTPRIRIGGTGVVADLDTGRPGPTLLLRADMDALPITEVEGRPYGSRVPGTMHACGHDAHTSSLLGAAELLVSRKSQLMGRVRFLFQPAEETAAGALAVISDGALDGVDEAVAAHVFSQIPLGRATTREGEMLVGGDAFELTVKGGGGHSGLAHEARDAVLAAAQIVTASQAIVSRETAPHDLLVVSVASIQGGDAVNVIADEVVVRGTVRWLTEATRERAVARLDEIAAGVCSAFRVSHRLEVTITLPVLRCSAEPTALLRGAAAGSGLELFDNGIMTVSEDFAHIAERLPAAFIAIGAGGPGCGAHHSPRFDIDERAIGLTAEVLARAAVDRLATS